MPRYGENRGQTECPNCGHPKMAHMGGPCHCGCRGVRPQPPPPPKPARRAGGGSKLLPPRVGAPWTLEEDIKLKVSFGKGLSISELARAHGRLPGGIRARLRKFGLID